MHPEKRPPTAGHFVLPKLKLGSPEGANSLRGRQAKSLHERATPVTLPKLKFMEDAEA